MNDTVKADSLVTLHFRVALPEGGQVLISTFESTPATLKLGSGELAPALEARLAGLEVGSNHMFELEPGEVFGEHKADLVERFARSDIPDDIKLDVNSVVEFTDNDGNKFPGLVREVDEQSALIDFNHPLAGRAVHFWVEVIGVS